MSKCPKPNPSTKETNARCSKSFAVQPHDYRLKQRETMHSANTIRSSPRSTQLSKPVLPNAEQQLNGYRNNQQRQLRKKTEGQYNSDHLGLNHDKNDNKSLIYVVELKIHPEKYNSRDVLLMESTRRRPVWGSSKVYWWAIRHTTISGNSATGSLTFNDSSTTFEQIRSRRRMVRFFGIIPQTAKRTTDSGHDPDNHPTGPTRNTEVKKLFGNTPRPIWLTVGWTIWNLSLQIRRRNQWSRGEHRWRKSKYL